MNIKEQNGVMKNKIIELVSKAGQMTPKQISYELELSQSMTQRHLKRLVSENKLVKKGVAPKVLYLINFKNDQEVKIPNKEELRGFVENVLPTPFEDNFTYIKSDGTEVGGLVGFVVWCQDRGLDMVKSMQTYLQTITEYDAFYRDGSIDATKKIKSSFGNNQNLDSLHYLFFYSLPVFGRTKISNWLFYGKQLQQQHLIKRVLDISLPLIHKFITENEIRAICFVPPSVPRKLQFMKELENALNIRLPKINIVKVQTPITIQQKSLKSIEDRIINAESTMFVEGNGNNFENILIIDDFTGSGATLNVLAGKIKKQNIARKVLGLTITGSVNGFEVVKEV
jgi:predicted amidophosphoribosyltransferase